MTVQSLEIPNAQGAWSCLGRSLTLSQQRTATRKCPDNHDCTGCSTCLRQGIERWRVLCSISASLVWHGHVEPNLPTNSLDLSEAGVWAGRMHNGQESTPAVVLANVSQRHPALRED